MHTYRRSLANHRIFSTIDTKRQRAQRGAMRIRVLVSTATTLGILLVGLTQASTITAGMHVATKCTITSGGATTAMSSVTRGEQSTSAIADNSKPYIGYHHLFGARNQTNAATAVDTRSGVVSC